MKKAYVDSESCVYKTNNSHRSYCRANLGWSGPYGTLLNLVFSMICVVETDLVFIMIFFTETDLL